ncbi:hypothetical protein BH10BAC5_BH10BAC5_05680 [soil metagenome]
MKKFPLFILFLSFSSIVHSQSFSLGYRTGKGDFKSLDFIIERYNETRPTLVKRMENISAISGTLFGLDLNIGSISLGLQIPTLKTEIVSSQTSSQTRELYLKLSGFEVNISYFKQILRSGSFHLYSGGGLSLDNNSTSAFTRVTDINSTVPEFTEIKTGSSISTGVSAFLNGRFDFNSFAIFAEAKPFYKFSISNPDLSALNQNINPSTYFNDDAAAQKESMNCYGIDLRAGLTVVIF